VLTFTSAALPLVDPTTFTDTLEEADCPRLLVAVKVKTYVPATNPEIGVVKELVVLLIFAVLGPLVSFQDSDVKLVPLAAIAVACRKLELPPRLWALPALTTGTVLEEPPDVEVPPDVDAVPFTVTDTVEDADWPRLLVAVKVKTYVPDTNPEIGVVKELVVLLIFAVLGPLVSFQDSEARLVPLAAVAVACR